MSENLFEKFGRIEWLFHRYHQHNHRRRGPMGDPHRGQGRVLAMLSLKPQISQKELSYLLDIRPQSLGELLGKLEKGGYLTRSPSETDRRVMEIELTEKGRQAAQRPESPDDLFQFFSEEEKETLGGYLTRLIEALEEQLDGEPQEEMPCGPPHCPPPPEDFPHLHRRHCPPHAPGEFPHPHGCPEGPPPFPPEWDFGLWEERDKTPRCSENTAGRGEPNGSLQPEFHPGNDTASAGTSPRSSAALQKESAPSTSEKDSTAD